MLKPFVQSIQFHQMLKSFGPYEGSLSNAGETLALEDKNGATVCGVRYNDRGKWPVAADGAGHSIRLKNKYLSCENFDNWIASASRVEHQELKLPEQTVNVSLIPLWNFQILSQ